MEGLKGKVAIVTGGATIIGAAVVRAFHREGTKVAIADINEKDGQAVASALSKDVQFVETDLADDAQIAACVRFCTWIFFRIDLRCTLTVPSEILRSFAICLFCPPLRTWLRICISRSDRPFKWCVDPRSLRDASRSPVSRLASSVGNTFSIERWAMRTSSSSVST